eukprot:TRINITY_DN28710_c0_g1_i1.p1 TRINITY_DN28710_c0_g1~~TRINITY_DN28710_c0_g1_i1.p1  ORF type:complete len:134 (-),score=26.14 TRINITY_DN28710_c0_g1_i1:337-738(-)
MGAASSGTPKEYNPAATSALLLAARRCEADAARGALAADANPNVQSEKSGRTALSFAAQCEEGADLIKALVKAKALVDTPAKDGRTPLHVAVSWEKKAAVGLLLDAGASRDVKDKHGLSPRILAERRKDLSVN